MPRPTPGGVPVVTNSKNQGATSALNATSNHQKEQEEGEEQDGDQEDDIEGNDADDTKDWTSSRKDRPARRVGFRLPDRKTESASSSSASRNRLKDAIQRRNDAKSPQKKVAKNYTSLAEQAARRGKSPSPARDPVSFAYLQPHLWDILSTMDDK